jgi:hypothetical protein
MRHSTASFGIPTSCRHWLKLISISTRQCMDLTLCPAPTCLRPPLCLPLKLLIFWVFCFLSFIFFWFICLYVSLVLLYSDLCWYFSSFQSLHRTMMYFRWLLLFPRGSSYMFVLICTHFVYVTTLCRLLR